MKTLLFRTLTLIAGAMFLHFSAGAAAAPLFDDHQILDVRIDAPLTTLLRSRPDEEYLDGKLAYTGTDGQEHSFDLKLQTRGKFRRQKKTCEFPPVRLNFRSQQVAGTIFDSQDKLKLVTHCNTRRARYEQLVLREYLAYEILQTLTDKSFGARLLRITWFDDEDDDEPFTRYGFVIEDDDDVGARIGMESLETDKLNYSDLDQSHTNLMTVYEYLIGNTDYSLIRGPADDGCCHNAVPFSDGNVVWPVPYDFDFSGLVDAPYAEPAPQFKIRSVRSRVYRGRCSSNELLAETLDKFEASRLEIYGLVDALIDLDDRNRKQVTKYLDSFYAAIEDDKKIQKNLIRKCS
jgi:hypothetical protein